MSDKTEKKNEEKKPDEPKADPKPAEMSAVKKALLAEMEAKNGTGNLTRDNLITYLASKHVEAGKSEDEAKRLATKRAFDMIRD